MSTETNPYDAADEDNDAKPSGESSKVKGNWDRLKPTGRPAGKEAKRNAELRDPNPERMKDPFANLDDTMISGKTDAGITTPGPARTPGSNP